MGADTQVRLTSYCQAAGCAAKLASGDDELTDRLADGGDEGAVIGEVSSEPGIRIA